MRLIISGAPGAGKTTLIGAILDRLHHRFSPADFVIQGLVTQGEWKDGLRSGYTLVNIANNHRQRFAETYHFPNAIKVGRYFVYPEALTFGLNALTHFDRADAIVIDEVGRWELNGAGWFPALERLTRSDLPKLEIWGVGEKNVSAVQKRWPRQKEIVIDVNNIQSPAEVNSLLERISDITSP